MKREPSTRARKKLALSRDTLRALSETDLAQVRGGKPTYPTQYCPPTWWVSCNPMSLCMGGSCVTNC